MSTSNSAISSRIDKHFPGQLLQMYRKRSGLTQAELANALGLKGKRMVQSWEVGENLPTYERLKQLIELYTHQNSFIVGQELLEAHYLWRSVKQMYEANNARSTYPIFDVRWFELLIPKASSATASTATGELPSIQPPFNQFPDHNLPALCPALIGREVELNEILDRLSNKETQLITIFGSAGVGKSGLALALAHTLTGSADYEKRIYWLDCVNLIQPEQLTARLVQLFGLEVDSPLDRLTRRLQDKKLVVVLDNFERSLGAISTLINLLGSLPLLKIVVTSRILLQLHLEQPYYLRPLPLPNRQPARSGQELRLNPAIQLFLERAYLVKPDFRLTEENLQEVAQICSSLDGLPLALELAAARLKFFSPRTILSMLNNRLDLLNGGPTDSPARHRSWRATLDWSFNLLEPPERELFQRLGVFSNDFGLSAVERLCSDLVGHTGRELITGLINKSLVYQEPLTLPGLELADQSGLLTEPRFRLLETSREYALERLKLSGRLDQISRLQFDYARLSRSKA